MAHIQTAAVARLVSENKWMNPATQRSEFDVTTNVQRTTVQLIQIMVLVELEL